MRRDERNDREYFSVPKNNIESTLSTYMILRYLLSAAVKEYSAEQMGKLRASTLWLFRENMIINKSNVNGVNKENVTNMKINIDKNDIKYYVIKRWSYAKDTRHRWKTRQEQKLKQSFTYDLDSEWIKWSKKYLHWESNLRHL